MAARISDAADESEAAELAATAAEADDAYDVAVALAQLQGLPHPDDPVVDGDGEGGEGGNVVRAAEQETPVLVGSCALPSEKVRTALLPVHLPVPALILSPRL